MEINEINKLAPGENINTLNQQLQKLHNASKPEKEVETNISKEKPLQDAVENQEQSSPEELSNAVQEMNSHLKVFNSRLSFSYNEELKSHFLQVKDLQSGEVLKQLPPEEMLESLKRMSDIIGLLVDHSV